MRSLRMLCLLTSLSTFSISLLACGVGPEDGAGSQEAVDSSLIGSPLIGLVFVQPAGVGFASYHFDAADDIYLNYENLELPMGNGLTVPSKKAFTSTSFDGAQRMFVGTVDWSEPEGTTVLGTQVWNYEMIFDESYGAIVGGTVTAYPPSGSPAQVRSFVSDLSYERL